MEIGCKKEELEKFLDSDELSLEVRQDEENAKSKGVHGVPYFMVNNEVIIGAASKTKMKKVLLRALNKLDESKNDTHPEGVVCDESGCFFKKKLNDFFYFHF